MTAAADVEPYDAAASAPSDVVYFSSSFHGRTMGALALTYKDQYKTPFAPVMPGAKMAEYQNLESAKRVIKKVSPHIMLISHDGMHSLHVAFAQPMTASDVIVHATASVSPAAYEKLCTY